jgi:hypothetical protein
MRFVEYTIPKRHRIFEEGEVRNAYLSQTMSNKIFEDKDRAILTKYLEDNTWNMSVNQQVLDKDVERGQRSVFKYKPVALRVKPVIQELPSKFRIIRDIKGDPLAEMPELSPNPSDFEPIGRYTQERKEQFDKQHEGDSLLAEEKKLLQCNRVMVLHGMIQKEVHRWSGYEGTDEETSWIPANELRHASEIVSEFHLRYPSKPGPLLNL